MQPASLRAESYMYIYTAEEDGRRLELQGEDSEERTGRRGGAPFPWRVSEGLSAVLILQRDSLSTPPSASEASRDACMNVWMYGCMDVWKYGCMDVWVYGCMYVWMYGCMDVWVSVSGAAVLQTRTQTGAPRAC
eukprot:GHVU01223449.1.p2 GENE.GHVU01223449.1~~GHVU01223449.1.p2  ORF type:complete len:134 (+),score=9.25 GHVU01223449.1:383-784(+)